MVAGPPYESVVRLCIAAAADWSLVDGRYSLSAPGSSPFDLPFPRFLNFIYALILESLQYDKEGLEKWRAELDSPLPGQGVSEAAAERQAQDEMALFKQAQSSR